MQRTGCQLLARAGRSDNHNTAVGLGRALDGLAKLIHASGASRQNASCRCELLEFLDFALQPRGLERPRGHQNKPVGLERLFNEVVSAALDGSDRGFDIAMPGNHDDRHVDMVPFDLLQQL